MRVPDLRVRENGETPAFRVHLVNTEETRKFASSIMRLTNESWHFRLGAALSAEAIDAKTSADKPENIQKVKDGIEGKTDPVAQYSVALEEDTDELLGFVRIATYVPKNPFKQNYPNITDLEVKPPMKQHGLVGAGLLYFGLGQFDSKQAVSLYSEEPNAEGNEWFEGLGLSRTGLTPEEKLTDDAKLKYVQFERKKPGVATVKDALLTQYTALRYLPRSGQ
jgi:hypothetical protein